MDVIGHQTKGVDVYLMSAGYLFHQTEKHERVLVINE
jgi:hypothetical protein